MWAIGSDVATETADAVLMSDDIAKLPCPVRHSSIKLAVTRTSAGLRNSALAGRE